MSVFFSADFPHNSIGIDHFTFVQLDFAANSEKLEFYNNIALLDRGAVFTAIEQTSRALFYCFKQKTNRISSTDYEFMH
jgi:hypothetical protein